MGMHKAVIVGERGREGKGVRVGTQNVTLVWKLTQLGERSSHSTQILKISDTLAQDCPLCDDRKTNEALLSDNGGINGGFDISLGKNGF